MKEILKKYFKIYIPGVDNFQCTETCHEGVGEMHRSWQNAQKYQIEAVQRLGDVHKEVDVNVIVVRKIREMFCEWCITFGKHELPTSPEETGQITLLYLFLLTS